MSLADLGAAQLYGIIDLGYVRAAEVPQVADAMLRGGVDVIQLRAKEFSAAQISAIAVELHHTTAERNIPLVMNDHPEVARDVSAEGVHIGQDDGAVASAREIVGASCLVGRSTHSLEQATCAAADGVDYIGFGPLFATPTKPNYVPVGLENIRAVQAAVSVPVFCIGGIKLENLESVIAAGAKRVVIVSGLLRASDTAQYARAAKTLLDRAALI